MKKKLRAIVLECVFDLGITVVYAVIVGFLIVGIVASDEGPISILHTSLCALALPGIAVLLLVSEIALRLFREWKQTSAYSSPIERSLTAGSATTS